VITILRREPTPNPSAFKYHTNTMLVREGALSYGNDAEAEKLPVANALFELGTVTAVMVAEDFISVSGNEWADWQAIEEVLKREVPKFDRDDASSQAEAALAAQQAARAAAGGNELMTRINEMVDMFVRPALAGDGGGLQIVEVTGDKIVRVRYQGACGSCPSASAGTLNAIEALLRNKVDPEITLEPA
jgi:NFU1 iron-sulfur cluster scaffold homolog, mitochondrial